MKELVANFGWIYTVPALMMFLGLIIISMTKYGSIKLTNQYPVVTSTWKYYCMVFSCGMGVSMLTWGMLEPEYHRQGGASVAQAISYAIVDWGPAWAIYAGFAIAIMITKSYKHSNHIISKVLMAGVTVLGLVLTYVYILTDIKSDHPILFIVAITAVGIASSISGILKGINWLSQATIATTLLILVYVIVMVGDVQMLVNGFEGVLLSLYDVPVKLGVPSTFISDTAKVEWLSGWAYPYYAAWWGWIVFSGLFVATISNGRTIRQIVFGAVLLPLLLTIVWFTVFTSLNYSTGISNIRDLLVTLPLGSVTPIIYTACMILFFVTSVDSAGLVLEDLFEGKVKRQYWIMLMATVAVIIVTLMTDALQYVRTLIAVTTVPVLLITISMIVRAWVSHRTAAREAVQTELRASGTVVR